MTQARARTAATLGELAERFGGHVQGDPSVRVSQVASIEAAGPGDITFLANPKYTSRLAATRASAAIISPKMAASLALPATLSVIISADPYLFFARVAQAFNPPQHPAPGVHPSAVVDSAVPASAAIGPRAVIGRDVVLGEGVIIEAGCVIGDNVTLGEGAWLAPNVTVYAGCQIGTRVRIHAGTVIGADGFGFARTREATWVKIPQIGRVIIGNDVEIGANTSIDRGALGDTLIGEGAILDNQIQVGHNVVIGPHTAIAGCVGIAGSTRIGARCLIGGAAMIIGHLEIADDVTISSCTMVSKSITTPGVVTSMVPQQSHDEWLKNFSQLRHLSKFADRLRALEQRFTDTDPAS